MIIDCISDLHGHYPELEGGDLLIVAGDLTARDTPEEWAHYFLWQGNHDYKKIIFIAGNHDGRMQSDNMAFYSPRHKVDYLRDSGTEFEGLKIWGSPWTPTFGNWSFMKNRGEQIKEKWDLIPDDIDILITHGPPQGILDSCEDLEYVDMITYVGCEELRKAVNRVKPKLHVFGHIHEHGGKMIDNGETKFVNASIMNERYKPINKPVRIIL